MTRSLIRCSSAPSPLASTNSYFRCACLPLPPAHMPTAKPRRSQRSSGTISRGARLLPYPLTPSAQQPEWSPTVWPTGAVCQLAALWPRTLTHTMCDEVVHGDAQSALR